MSMDYPEFIHAKMYSYNGQTWRRGESVHPSECDYARRDLYDDVLDALKLMVESTGTPKMADACDVARMTLKRHGR